MQLRDTAALGLLHSQVDFGVRVFPSKVLFPYQAIPVRMVTSMGSCPDVPIWVFPSKCSHPGFPSTGSHLRVPVWIFSSRCSHVDLPIVVFSSGRSRMDVPIWVFQYGSSHPGIPIQEVSYGCPIQVFPFRTFPIWIFPSTCSLLGVPIWMFPSRRSHRDVPMWIFSLWSSHPGVPIWMFPSGYSHYGVSMRCSPRVGCRAPRRGPIGYWGPPWLVTHDLSRQCSSSLGVEELFLRLRQNFLQFPFRPISGQQWWQ